MNFYNLASPGGHITLSDLWLNARIEAILSSQFQKERTVYSRSDNLFEKLNKYMYALPVDLTILRA